MTLADQLRKMGFKDDMISGATIHGRPLAEVDKPRKKQSDGWPGYKSKWESLYSVELEWQRKAGEITVWFYEPITFHLTESSIVDGKRVRAITYTPDFVCWLPDGRMRCVEIKGYRRTKDINRFKQAKDRFRHIEFVMVKRENNSWKRLPY